MRKMNRCFISLSLIPFLLLYADQADPFNGINDSGPVINQGVNSEDGGQSQDRNRYVVIDKEFWATNFSKYVEVDSFDSEFPHAEFPVASDFYLRFDDKVVNSFSDHMLTSKIPLIHDMFYNLHGDNFRVTVLLNYSELNKIDALKGLVELQGASERRSKQDKAILAIDISLKIFNLQDQSNTIFLAFKNAKTYRFWRDGRDSKAMGDRTNENLFRRYVSDSVKGSSGATDFMQRMQDLERQQRELELAEKYKEALEISKQIKQLQMESEYLRIVEDRFNTQINLKPKFIGTLLEFLKQSQVFNKYLELTHYHVVSGKSKQNITQLIKVSQLEKALKLALPQIEINYVNIAKGQMTLSGRVVE